MEVSGRPHRRSNRQLPLFPDLKVSLRRRLLKAVPLALVAIAVSAYTIYQDTRGIISQFRESAFDSFLRMGAPSDNDDIVVVKITQHDYEEIFQGKSNPLDAATVVRLVSAVAAGRPKVIGVDILTDHPSYAQVELPPLPPVVWAQEADDTGRGFAPRGLLGGSGAAHQTGLVHLPEDAGRVFRRYRRLLKTAGGELKPTFPWAVATAYNGSPSTRTRADETDFFIRYRRNPNRSQFTASQVLDRFSDEGWRGGGPLPGPVEGKIVLIGGAFSEARDEHDTPLGSMYGVEIMAQAVEMELRGDAIPLPKLWVIVILELIDCLLLVLLFHRLELEKALLCSLFLIPLATLVCSFVAFGTISLWVFFVPILGLILIQQLYDRAKDYRKALAQHLYDYAHESVASPGLLAEVPKRVSEGVERAEGVAGRLSRHARSWGERIWRRRGRPVGSSPSGENNLDRGATDVGVVDGAVEAAAADGDNARAGD